GKTSLGSGERVPKDDARIQAIGDVDELNSFIGVALHHVDDRYQSLLIRIQNDLFDVGADLCLPDLSLEGVLRMRDEQVHYLEEQIDEENKTLSALTSFVLPGGSEGSAYFHGLRSIARRAERSVCALNHVAPLNAVVIQYLNRLSD